MPGYQATPRLPLHLAAAFTLLVIYASLHPFSGWRDSGAPMFAWLTAAWPRYFTVFDLVTNVLAYLPLGFFWSTTFQAALRRHHAALAATVIAMTISFFMETLQNFLPTRVSSNVDLGCNTLGGALGAILAIGRGRTLLAGGRLEAWRQRWFIAGNLGDAGLIIAGLWLLSQLNPETLLFGTGDLRSLLDLEGAISFDVERFPRIETAIAAANTLAAGLLVSCLMRRRRLVGVLLVLATALLVRTFAAMLLESPEHAFHWLTPGNSVGVAIGLLLLLPCLALTPSLRRALTGMALLFATVLVNLSPENPYLSVAAQIWKQGHFLNFNGLTRLASALWPFLALPWLLTRESDPWQK